MHTTSRLRDFTHIFLFLLALFITIPNSFAAEDHLPGTTLRSASELDYPPFAIVRPDGSADGFSVDILKAVAEINNFNLKITVGPWHEIKHQLEEGNLDVLPLVAYSDAREKIFDFTAPYLEMRGTIFVRKGETSIQSEADLKNKEVLVMRSDAAHEYAVKNQISNNLILTDSFEDAMTLLSQGKHDAVLCQYLMGLQLISKLNISNIVSVSPETETSLKISGRPVSGFVQKFCIAVQDGDKKLLNRLNEGLSIVIANGTYDKLYKKWFSPILPQPKIPLTTILHYVFMILTPILLLIALGGVIFQKRQMGKREIARRELQIINDQLEVMFASTHVCLVMLDSKFNFVRVNKNYADVCGYPPDFFPGKNHFDLYPHEENQAIFQNVVDTGEAFTIHGKSFDFPDKPELGTTYWDWTLSPIKDESSNVTGLIFTLLDVTVPRINELELGKHRDHLEQIVAGRIQFETLIMQISSRFINLPAEKVDEGIEKALGEICTMTNTDSGYLFQFSDDHTTVSMTHLWKNEKITTKKNVMQEIDVSSMPWRFERILSRNNVIIPTVENLPEQAHKELKNIEERGLRSLLDIPMVYENQIKGFLGFSSATPDRQWTSEEIMLLNIVGQVFTNALQRKQSVQKLLTAKTEAEKSNKAKSEFLANMSHEIRTPMNVIIGMTRLAIEHTDDSQQRDYLETVQFSAESLLSLIDDILDYSKIESGQIEIRKRPCNIKKILNDIIRSFSLEAQQKGLEFSYTYKPVTCKPLLGDEDKLYQILVNIVGNALKFTESGNILIKAEELHRDDHNVLMQFSIKDTGIGISEEFQDYIFDKFSQEDSSTTRQYGGTGLGLAIAKKLVELQGGTIWFESAPGKGSTFYFTCNFTVGDIVTTVRRKGKLQSKDTASDSLRILLAEDNRFNRFYAKTVFEKQGHNVTEAENGLEVLEKLATDSFDIILMDLQMPQLDGLETTKFIRACEQQLDVDNHEHEELLARVSNNISESRTPVIAMTAHAMAEDKQQCMEAGMDDYVTKPFKPEAVLNVIQRVLKRNRKPEPK